MNPRQLLGIWFCGTLLLVGCERGPSVAPVSGVITHQGAPLASAHVTFTPLDGGTPASGFTDANGRFALQTFSNNDGALVGKHRVSIIARGPDRPLRPGEVGTGLPGDMAAGEPKIPVKFFAPDSSGLEREVVPGPNEMTIDIPK